MTTTSAEPQPPPVLHTPAGSSLLEPYFMRRPPLRTLVGCYLCFEGSGPDPVTLRVQDQLAWIVLSRESELAAARVLGGLDDVRLEAIQSDTLLHCKTQETGVRLLMDPRDDRGQVVFSEVGWMGTWQRSALERAPLPSSAEALRTRLTEALANLAMPGVRVGSTGLGLQISVRLSDPGLRQGVLISLCVDRLADERERTMEFWVLDLPGGSAALTFYRPATAWETDMIPEGQNEVRLRATNAQQHTTRAALELRPLAPASLEPEEAAHAG